MTGPRPKLRPVCRYALACVATLSSVAALAEDGPIMPPSGADLVIDDFESTPPRYRLERRHGKPNVTATLRHGIRYDGNSSLLVEMGTPTTEGKNETGLVWRFDPPMDSSGYDELTFWYQSQDDDYHDFICLLGERGGVAYRKTAKGKPGMAGKWQCLSLDNRTWTNWYHESARDPDKRLDMTRITSFRIRLWANVKKPYAFALDGLGLRKEKQVYRGPEVTIRSITEPRDKLRPGQDYRFKVEVSEFSAGERTDVRVRATDYFGAVTEIGRFAATGSSDGAPVTREFSLANAGPNHIRAEAVLSRDGKDIYRSWVDVACIKEMEPEDAAPNPDSIFGIWVGGGHGEIGAKRGRSYTRATDAYLDGSDIKFKHDPKNGGGGVYDTHYLVYTPKWLTSEPDAQNWQKYPPTDWDAYGKYVEAATRRNKANGFTIYEIWNEPNPWAYWMGTAEEVVKLAEVTYKAIKKVQPDATVLGPCPYSFTWDFLETFFKNGGGNWIDHVVIHAYTPVPPDETFAQNLKKLREMMREYDIGDKDIYITEMGYSTPAVDEKTVAQCMVRAYAYALSQNVKLLTWHMLWQYSKGGDPGFAIKRNDHSPPPAFTAYATMTRVLERATYVKPVDGLSGTQRGFEFEKRTKRVLVLWDYGKDARSRCALALRTDRATVINIVGGETIIERPAEGAFSFELDNDAKYVVYAPKEMPPAAQPEPADAPSPDSSGDVAADSRTAGRTAGGASTASGKDAAVDGSGSTGVVLGAIAVVAAAAVALVMASRGRRKRPGGRRR